MRKATGILSALAGILAAAPAAMAQEHGGDEGGQSLLQIVINGFEWPAWFIVAGSITVISLVVEHFITIRRGTIVPTAQVKKAREHIEKRDFRGCLDALQKSPTYFARTMTAALQHARHGFDAMHEAALEKAGENSGRLFRKVEYMNILGNLGPLMGLLGTVLGMIAAFGAMSGGGGEASASDLAKGISLALVNTLLGLGLAVIGLGFFGVCRNRIDSLTVEATVLSLDLLEYFRPAPSGSRSGEARRSSRGEAKSASSSRPAAKETADT